MKKERLIVFFVVLVIILGALEYFVNYGEFLLSPDDDIQTSEFIDSRTVELLNYEKEIMRDKWIVEFETKPLIELKKELENLGLDEGAVQDRLAEQKGLIQNNVDSLEREIESIDGEFYAAYYHTFSGASVRKVYENDLVALKERGIIKYYFPDLEVHALLLDSVPLIGANSVWERGYTGEGISIGIIDTGVDYTHQDFGSCTAQQFLTGRCAKIIDGWDFVNQDNDPMDDDGHGTHVAATAAGKGDYNGNNIYEPNEFWGVAPNADIVAYKVLDDERGGFSEVIHAIERAVDPNQDGNSNDHLDVISLSLGGFCGGIYNLECGPEDVVSRSIDNAIDAGVVAVIAAGNSGLFGNERTIDSPGVAEKAITVGASYKKDYENFFIDCSLGEELPTTTSRRFCGNNYPFSESNSPNGFCGPDGRAMCNYWNQNNPFLNEIISFSSRGPIVGRILGQLRQEHSLAKPDVVAPGAMICAANYAGGQTDPIFHPTKESPYFYSCIDERHIQFAGTSMATPHVSGLAALLLEKNPTWSPLQVKTAIRESANYLPGETIFDQGFGVANALRAIEVNDPPVAFFNPIMQDTGIIDITGEIRNVNMFECRNGEPAVVTVKDNAGTPVAEFFTNGDISLKGSCIQSQTLSPPPDATIIKNNAEQVIGYIDNEGDLYVVGGCNLLQSSCPADADFVVLDDLGVVVSSISDSGLCAIGSLWQNRNTYYKLSWAQNRPLNELQESDWRNIESSSCLPVNNVLADDFQIPNEEGEYLIRLDVFDEGKTARDYGYLKVVKRFEMIEPLNNDVANSNEDLKVKIRLKEGYSNVHVWRLLVEYKRENDLYWRTWGVTTNPVELSAYISKEAFRDYMGKVDVRVSVFYEDRIEIFEKKGIFMDKYLKVGWPQRVEWGVRLPFGDGRYAGPLFIGVGNVTPGDEKEIIVFRQGTLNLGGYSWDLDINIYSASGDSSSFRVPNVRYRGLPKALDYYPLLVDIDDDGLDEIILHDSDRTLYAFNHDGTSVAGWPVRTHSYPFSASLPSVMAADLDYNGEPEIILYDSTRSITIIKKDGTIQNQWNVPPAHHCLGGHRHGKPAVGNFDNDNELEIVAPSLQEETGCETGSLNSQLLVYNIDGTLVDGWPQPMNGLPYASPVVGDVNNNGGVNVIIPTTDSLYAFNKDGSLFWRKNEYYSQTTPSLFDIEDDGFLEIGINTPYFDYRGTRYDAGFTYILDMNGDPKTIFGGRWPQRTKGTYSYSTVFGDLGEHGQLLILTPRKHYYYFEESPVEQMYGWWPNGVEYPPEDFFPKKMEISASAPVVIADLDNDKRAEIIATSDEDTDYINYPELKPKNRGSIYVWEYPCVQDPSFPPGGGVIQPPGGGGGLPQYSPSQEEDSIDGGDALKEGAEEEQVSEEIISGDSEDSEIAGGDSPTSPAGNCIFDESKQQWPQFHHDKWLTGTYFRI